jgi:hypothetical protein
VLDFKGKFPKFPKFPSFFRITGKKKVRPRPSFCKCKRKKLPDLTPLVFNENLGTAQKISSKKRHSKKINK